MSFFLLNCQILNWEGVFAVLSLSKLIFEKKKKKKVKQ